MCYSKEVSLTTAILVLAGCALLWQMYHMRAGRARPFIASLLLGFAFIGSHQLFDSLSIFSQSEIVYKIGLLVSISSMYFFMRSFEILSARRFSSALFVPFIALVGVYIFMTPMTFENYKFWVRGNSHLIWSIAWLILFGYWNACIIYTHINDKLLARKRLALAYGFFTLNLSFLLSVAYVFISLAANALELYKDSPSIWCTFSLVQLFLLPHLFRRVIKEKVWKKQANAPVKVQLFLLLATCAVLGVLYLLLPQFTAIATGFSFR